jgi:outer membrane protein OmpA-like peptidoglycan-associated protein
MLRYPLSAALGLILIALNLSGCATKEFVNERLQGLDASLKAHVSALQDELNKRIASGESQVAAQGEKVVKLESAQTTLQTDLERQAARSEALAETAASKTELSTLATEVGTTAATVRDLQASQPQMAATLEQRITELGQRLDGQITERTGQLGDHLAAHVAAQTERIETGEVKLARLAEQAQIHTTQLEAEQVRNERQDQRLLEQTGLINALAAANNEESARGERLAQALAEQNEAMQGMQRGIEDIDHIAKTAFATAERLDALRFKGEKLAEVVLQFDLESAALSPLSIAALDGIAEQARNIEGDYAVELRGFTDVTGSDAYNLRLGERRAEAVRLRLTREGSVPLNRLYSISHGELDPVADNKKRSGRIENRRVSVVLLH